MRVVSAIESSEWNVVLTVNRTCVLMRSGRLQLSLVIRDVFIPLVGPLDAGRRWNLAKAVIAHAVVFLAGHASHAYAVRLSQSAGLCDRQSVLNPCRRRISAASLPPLLSSLACPAFMLKTNP